MESWQRLTRVTLDSRRAKCAEIALMTSESIVHFASLHATSSQKQSYPLQCCFFVKAHFLLSHTNPLKCTSFLPLLCPFILTSLSPCHCLLSFTTQPSVRLFPTVASWSSPCGSRVLRAVRNFRQLCNHAPPGLLPGCTGMLPSCSTPYTADHNRK